MVTVTADVPPRDQASSMAALETIIGESSSSYTNTIQEDLYT